MTLPAYKNGKETYVLNPTTGVAYVIKDDKIIGKKRKVKYEKINSTVKETY